VRGLRVARSNEGSLGLLSNLFSCRTLGLTGQLGPAAQSEYLSGLLIGHELHALSQAQAFDLQHPVVLCGEAALCQRYAMALEIYGFDQPIVYTQVTALGLWGMALAAGLV
jgi:2-dehydro-3-deoxygalactonokinase